jgi:hypothetical protein
MSQKQQHIIAIQKALSRSDTSARTRAALEELSVRSTRSDVAFTDSDIDTAINLAAAADSVAVAAAGLTTAAYFARASGRGADGVLGVVRELLESSSQAIRSAALDVAADVLAEACPSDVVAFASWCTGYSAVVGADGWQRVEARVMALSITTRIRGADSLCRPGLMSCVFGDALPLCGESSNTYVRAAGMHVCTCAVNAWSSAELAAFEEARGVPVNCLDDLTRFLSDSASSFGRDVRFSASATLRSIVLRWPASMILAEPHCSRLLPHLVLSRYYGPERQRRYCQHTWMLFLGSVAPGESSVFNLSSYAREPVHAELGASTSKIASVQWPSGAMRDGARAESPSRIRSLACAALDSHGSKESAFAFHVPPSQPSALLTGAPDVAAVPVGPELVARHAAPIARFYLVQLKNADADAREAAAHCTAELAGKVSKDAVRPWVFELLRGLLSAADCSDEWVARDASIVASAKLLCAFAVDVPQSFVSRLAALCADLVHSAPHSVAREHCAAVLVDLVERWPRLLPTLLQLADRGITGASGERLCWELEPLHFSADTLSADGATLREARPVGLDAVHSGAAVNAEVTSLNRLAGSSVLLRELVRVDCIAAARLLEKLLDTFAASTTTAMGPRELLCRMLPVICRGIGKTLTKRLLDALIEMLCGVVAESSGRIGPGCDRGAAAFAAADAILFLRDFVGKGVFAGHVSLSQASVLSATDTPLLQRLSLR